MKFIKLNILLNFVIFIFLTIPFNSIAQPGSLDLSFDGDGIVTTQIGASTQDYANSVAIQTDGKIVVAGKTYNPTSMIVLSRYNSDGSLDNSFDSDGIVTTLIGTSSSAYSVAIQSDGKIVVGGNCMIGSSTKFAVLRYNTNGSLDSTFDFDGIITSTINASNILGTSLKIQTDGRIVIAGSNPNGVNDQFAIIRYNTDGSLDNTFDFDGIVTTIIGTEYADVYGLAIQGDGKILLTGFSGDYLTRDITLARYNIDGKLDSTFDNDGIVITDLGNQEEGRAITLQNDGKIVVAGFSYIGTSSSIAVVRYNIDGSLDNTFDSDGIVLTAIGTTGNLAFSNILQSDGKILVAGSSSSSTYYQFSLIRYNVDGSLDSSFDTDGIVTTTFIVGSVINSIAIQSDEKIVVAGNVNHGGVNITFGLARYNSSFPAGIELLNDQTSDIEIFPNPFTSSTTIKSRNVFKNASISFYNLSGQQLKYMNSINGNSIKIERDNLPTGTYFIEVKEENKIPFKHKISITDF